jgi:hypothetical protein
LLQAYCGVVFFMSCMYVVPIIPHQYSKAGYNLQNTVSGREGETVVVMWRERGCEREVERWTTI